MLASLQRAPGMRAAADRDPVGVAGDEAHAVERHAEPFGDQLRERRLVALALRHGADEDLDLALGQYRHLGLLARRAGRGVDIVGDADAAAFAARPRLGAPRRQTVPVGQPQHLLHHLMVMAAVVDHAERVGVRHQRCRHEVPAPQFDAVDAGLSRSEVDQPLHDEHHLRPAGAAVGTGRRRVGQGGAGAEMHRRYVVDARHDLDPLVEGAEGERVRALVDEIGAAHRQKAAVLVERQLGRHREIARLVVGLEIFAALASPFDRPADPLRGPGDDREFRVEAAAGAEIAADILHHDTRRALAARRAPAPGRGAG